MLFSLIGRGTVNKVLENLEAAQSNLDVTGNPTTLERITVETMKVNFFKTGTELSHAHFFGESYKSSRSFPPKSHAKIT